jgi:hypothetical protein
MNLIRTLSAGALVVALTACVAPSKVTDEKDAKGNKIVYVYYTPTGSSIPVRVRQDQLKTSDDDAAASQKLILDAQRESALRSTQLPVGGGPQ